MSFQKLLITILLSFVYCIPGFVLPAAQGDTNGNSFIAISPRQVEGGDDPIPIPFIPYSIQLTPDNPSVFLSPQTPNFIRRFQKELEARDGNFIKRFGNTDDKLNLAIYIEPVEGVAITITYRFSGIAMEKLYDLTVSQPAIALSFRIFNDAGSVVALGKLEQNVVTAGGAGGSCDLTSTEGISPKPHIDLGDVASF